MAWRKKFVGFPKQQCRQTLVSERQPARKRNEKINAKGLNRKGGKFSRLDAPRRLHLSIHWWRCCSLPGCCLCLSHDGNKIMLLRVGVEPLGDFWIFFILSFISLQLSFYDGGGRWNVIQIHFSIKSLKHHRQDASSRQQALYGKHNKRREKLFHRKAQWASKHTTNMKGKSLEKSSFASHSLAAARTLLSLY